MFFGELERLFINEVIINLFARTYKPNDVVLSPGQPVPGVMFVLKGFLAVYEPGSGPFCIVGSGGYLGDFQTVKNIPWLFELKAFGYSEFET